MPVLAIGGEKSLGDNEYAQRRKRCHRICDSGRRWCRTTRIRLRRI